MKRSSFKKPTPEKLAELNEKKRERQLSKLKEKKPRKSAPVARGGKSKTQAWYKKELDRVFSIYIRNKYPKECYTCGKTDTPLQCGHFVPRQYLATRWHENNCRPQCVGCNIYGNGKILDFEEHLKRDLGEQYVEELKATRHTSLKLDTVWYKIEIEKYK